MIKGLDSNRNGLFPSFEELVIDKELGDNISPELKEWYRENFSAILSSGILAPDKKNLQRDEEGNLIRPDTYTADCFFAEYFLIPELKVEMGYLASDFLKQKNLEQYSSPRYWDSFQDHHDLSEVTLSLLICAARKGNEYARKLLVILYQRFYKKEFNQLKRFRVLHFSELPNLFEQPVARTAFYEMCRTLFMADMMGVEIAPDCFVLYQFLHEVKNFGNQGPFHNGVIRKGVLREGTLKKAAGLLPELFPADDDIEVTHEVYEDLFSTICRDHDTYEDLIDSAGWDISFEDRAARAIAFLWDTFGRDFEFTSDEVAMVMIMDDCVRGQLNQKDAQIRIFEEYIGSRTSEDIKKPQIEIKEPEKKEDSHKPGTQEKPKPEEKVQPEESVKEEITGLRLKLHERESTILELQEANKSLKGQIEGLNREREVWEKDQEELEALRKYVRSLEEEPLEQEVSIDEMKADLQEHKIAVIGGNHNWIKKISQAFPGWRFIESGVSPATTASSIQSMERIFFFTDSLSHSSYYKFVQIARNSGVPFSYIHGVNLDENIRWIYQEVNG